MNQDKSMDLLRITRILVAISSIFFYSLYAQCAIVSVGVFDESDKLPLSPWEVIQFSNKFPATNYQIINWDGVNAVEAVAKGSMALLARPVEVDLQEMPILCWRWRIDSTIESADIMSKAGDDYAARVYVSFKLPSKAISFGMRVKLGLARKIYGNHVPDAAINYVWDNKHPVGTQVSNAYTDRTQMVVVQSGEGNVNKWVEEQRDVLEDFNQIFGIEGATLVQIAIASDTDNTGETARAGFADLHFVGHNQDCQFSPL
jgi:hypothetical protein